MLGSLMKRKSFSASRHIRNQSWAFRSAGTTPTRCSVAVRMALSDCGILESWKIMFGRPSAIKRKTMKQLTLSKPTSMVWAYQEEQILFLNFMLLSFDRLLRLNEQYKMIRSIFKSSEKKREIIFLDSNIVQDINFDY